MSGTILTPEEFCREIAKKFPTPNTIQAIKYAEEGVLTWGQVAGIFAKAVRSMQAAVEVGLVDNPHVCGPGAGCTDACFTNAGDEYEFGEWEVKA